MGSKATRISMQTQERIRRLQTPSPYLQRRLNITKESAITLLSPLSETKVMEEDFKYAMEVLEFANTVSESFAVKVARYISSNLSLGIVNETDISLDRYEISDECKAILMEGISEAALCDRIIQNQKLLTKRFNVDNAVKRNPNDVNMAIEELCELIDTYSVPSHFKYNVALENVMYTLVKNGAVIKNEMDVVEAITEYFLLRDDSIPDPLYNKYKDVLEHTPIYDIHSNPSALVKCVLESTGHHYLEAVTDVLKTMDDDNLSKLCIDTISNIQTEASLLEYMDKVSDYMTRNKISKADEAKAYYSIKSAPKYANVSPDFVSIKRKEYFDPDRFDQLATDDSITSSNKVILDDKDDYSLLDKTAYLDAFKEENSEKVDAQLNDMLARHKASQDKSPNVVYRLLQKILMRKPKNIIEETPQILHIVGNGVLIGVAALSPITLVLAALVKLITMLLAAHINEKESIRLLESIRAEKKKMTEKKEKLKSDKAKQELQEYIDCLNKCEKKVEEYLATITDDDHGDPDSVGGGLDDDDDDDFGFDDDDDFDLESAVVMFSAGERILIEMLEGNDIDMKNMVKVLVENNLLMEASEIFARSSFDMGEYTDALVAVKEETEDVRVRTVLTAEQYAINKHDKLSAPKRIVAEAVANQVVREMEQQVLNEKFSLNTVKLLLQDGKAKLRNLNTKQQSLWQSVDAAGSGAVASIEKAMTSDRREAIIKGSLIPSLSKCIKGALALAGVGILFTPLTALIAAIGALGTSAALNHRERKLLMDEIDTELKVVEKQMDIAQSDGDMNQYRFLMNYQKKLTREYQRIRYGLRVSGRDIPQAVIPGRR